MIKFNIRKAVENDYPAIFKLLHEFAVFQKTPEKVKITEAQMFRDREVFQCIVATDEQGKIFGYATWSFVHYSWTGRAVYLDDLYVQPAFRGAKAGTALLEKIIELAKSAGCTRVHWQVSRWNKEAIAFYQKIGAVINEVEIGCDLPLNM